MLRYEAIVFGCARAKMRLTHSNEHPFNCSKLQKNSSIAIRSIDESLIIFKINLILVTVLRSVMLSRGPASSISLVCC